MNNYISIWDLDDFVFKELKKDLHIDKLHLSSYDRRKITCEIYAKNSKLTYIEKKIVSLYIGLENFKKHSVISIAKMLNLKVFQVRYYLNSAFYKTKHYRPKNSYNNDDILKFYNFDLNYEVFENTPLSALQYNVVILFFKYNVNPHDIEIYFLLPNLSTIILTLYRKYQNLIITKKGECQMDQQNFKITRSNRHILKDITNLEHLFICFVNSNPDSQKKDIFCTILEGNTKKADMEKHPQFKNVCKWIDTFREKNYHFSNPTLDNNENTNLSKEDNENENENENENKIEIDHSNNYSNLESVITDKLFSILKADIKIKKKKRKELYKLWKQKDTESLNIILNELDKIISKSTAKKSK